MKLKVIIIGNEHEILNVDNDVDYRRKKEKIVQRTFEVQPCPDAAIDVFIDQLQDRDVQKILKEQKSLLYKVFNDLQYQNLRDLRHALFDFEYFCKQLDTDYLYDVTFVKDILIRFICLSIEEKTGYIDESEWDYALSVYFEHNISYKAFQEKSKEEQNRLNTSVFYQLQFSPEMNFWKSVIFDGIIDSNRINAEIADSHYFKKEIETNLELLRSSWLNISDKEFESLYQKLITEIETGCYTQPLDLLYISALFLDFSELKIVSRTSDETKTWIKKIINDLTKNNQLTSGIRINEQGLRDLHIIKRDSHDFQEIYLYLKRKLKNVVKTDISIQLTKIIGDFPESFDDFWGILGNYDSNSIYYKVPILAYIDVNFFFEKFQLVNHNKTMFTHILQTDRYGIKKKYRNRIDEYFEELSFLESLAVLIEHKLSTEGVEMNPQNYFFKQVLRDLQEIVEFLKTHREKDVQ